MLDCHTLKPADIVNAARQRFNSAAAKASCNGLFTRHTVSQAWLFKMTDDHTPAGNVFDKLPNVLVQSILMWCSPIDEIHAAASCQALWEAYTYQQKQPASHWARFKGSTDGHLLLSPPNIRKLYLTLGHSFAFPQPEAVDVYRELQLCIKRTIKNGSSHLCSVQELGIQLEVQTKYNLRPLGQQCMHQLLKLFKNLKTLWIGHHSGSQLMLAHDSADALPSICRVSLELKPTPDQLVRVPALLPNLDTLCLAVNGVMDATWLQPLSQLSHLQYLSIELQGYHCPLHMHDIPSLRHLKVRAECPVNVLSIRELKQLESLNLCQIWVQTPECLADLSVSSLTLDGVELSYSGPRNTYTPSSCWTNLKTVNLGSDISEDLLQCLMLPHPTAGGLRVKLRHATFDSFDSEYRQELQPDHQRILCSDITYQAVKPPVLGPAYLAAAGITSLTISGDFAVEALQQMLEANMILQELCVNLRQNKYYNSCSVFRSLKEFPTLKKIQFVYPPQASSDEWCELLLKCPVLVDVRYAGKVSDLTNMETAAGQLGLTIVRPVGYIYRILRPGVHI